MTGTVAADDANGHNAEHKENRAIEGGSTRAPNQDGVRHPKQQQQAEQYIKECEYAGELVSPEPAHHGDGVGASLEERCRIVLRYRDEDEKGNRANPLRRSIG